ncbi:MAG: DnaJ domain-containing protein [Pseudomonadota bacterium]|nr:DnaJ domain-containing protein [Pseudomonadota bacterium]
MEEAAKVFGLSKPAYHRLRAAHFGLGADDPYLILGIEPGISLEAVKSAYRALSRNHHPDALMARGVPPDLVRISEGRMAAINGAYEQILTDYS